MTPSPDNSQTRASAPPSKEPNPTTLLLATAGEEEDYNSAEDEDFDPTAVPQPAAEESESPDSEPEHSTAKPKQKRKRRRGSSSSEGSYGDVSGGEGGLIKTRAQRLKESAEKEKVGGVLGGDVGATTTDVDELWRQMNSKPGPKWRSPLPEAKKEEVRGEGEEKKEDGKDGGVEGTNALGEEMTTISRTYTFAGKVISETKTVPKSSQEAQAYLSTLPSASSTLTTSASSSAPANGLPPRRPPPKKRASAFDSAAAARKPATPAPAQKLNTLEKSRLDWAGFVDKEGIGDELKKHTSGDKSYLDRQAFLGRVDEKRDKAWKEGKGK
ncbi:BCNT-domain-containing protein [Choiromyces venosus 120613-1]|uniref:SWR1-complex protein 5 n=1 Tax=Choiromyces venosus 120613-1 TaxID=1336337 RepID=A0A3N4K1B6_9PEZI|nr:BCNT-domain-containing protein [Choiromyces venosus 120613-1]